MRPTTRGSTCPRRSWTSGARRSVAAGAAEAAGALRAVRGGGGVDRRRPSRRRCATRWPRRWRWPGRSRRRGWHVYADHAAGSGDGNGDGAAASAGAAAVAASQRVEPFAAPGREERRRRPAGLGIHLAHNPAAFLAGLDIGVYGSAFKTCKGLIDRFGAGAGDRHAAGRIGHGRIRPGGIADGRAADRRVPVRRFLHRGDHATGPERRQLVLPQRTAGAAVAASAVRRRADGGGLSLGRVRGPLVAVPGAETALSGHAAGDLRGPAWPASTTPTPAWSSSTSCSTGAAAATSTSTATWRRSGGRGAGWKGATDAGGLRRHGARGGRGRGGARADRSKCGTRWCSSPGPGPHLRVDSQDGTVAGGAGGGRDARAGRPHHRAGRAASASRRCGAAPRLVAAPDVPVPFAPELEACCRPDARRIAAAIGQLMEEHIRWMSRCFDCRCTCPPKAPPRPRPPSSNGTSPRATAFRRDRCWPRSTAPSRSSISRPLATAWRCGSFTWKARRSP